MVGLSETTKLKTAIDANSALIKERFDLVVTHEATKWTHTVLVNGHRIAEADDLHHVNQFIRGIYLLKSAGL